MPVKKSFVLRIDQQKMETVEKWAADEFRSVNGQLEWIIDQAIKKSGRWKVNTQVFTNEENNEPEQQA